MFNTSWFIVFSIIAGVAIYLYCQNRYLKGFKKQDIYMETLIKNLPVGLYFRNLKGNILLANNEFSKITGVAKEKLDGGNIFDIFSKEYIETIIREDSLISKTKESISTQREIRFLNKKHSYRILKTPMFDESKNVIGFAVFLLNIDKECETESSRESFVATLTHDLKTPTNAQLSTLNMLLNGLFGKLNEEQRHMITLTKDSCQYMADLIATILDTYNYDSGQIELKFEEFDIISLICELCSNSNIMSENGQKIEFKKTCDKCIVYADRLQIKRVIVNLLSNALTYGYPQTPVKVVFENHEDSINLFIENKSKQIPESELKTIFDKFKKTKFSHFNKTGTGLGLYLARQVIKKHKGEIYARSFENGTCIFGFKLPVSKCIKSEQSSNII